MPHASVFIFYIGHSPVNLKNNLKFIGKISTIINVILFGDYSLSVHDQCKQNQEHTRLNIQYMHVLVHVSLNVHLQETGVILL